MAFAKAYMAMRECLVPDKTREVQEEIIADLHNCLEQLTDRCLDMESRIVLATDRMLVHAKAARAATDNIPDKIREKNKAKQYLQEKKRIQAEYDKTQRNIQLIQQQIDSIVSSQLNMVVVDAMKQFNHNATRLSLPSRRVEIEHLEEQLADRTREVAEMQEAMQSISTACTNIASASTGHNGDSSSLDDVSAAMNEEDEELWRELDLYLSPPSNVVRMRANTTAPAMIASTVSPSTIMIPPPPISLPDVPPTHPNQGNSSSSSSLAMQQLTMSEEEPVKNTVQII